MRVVHVINSLVGSGGAEHGLVREITHFSPGTEQLVVRLFAQDELGHALTARGIEVMGLGLDSANAGTNWTLGVKRLSGVIRGYRPDVVQSSLFTSNLVAQVTSALVGAPTLSTFTLSGDSSLLSRYQPGGGSRRARLLRALAARAARGRRVFFRALTHDTMVTNCDLLGVSPDRAEVIPRGVPTNLKPDPVKSRSELGLPPAGPLLVNVGRQAAQKGQLSLLEAFSRIREEVDAHLVIVGREGEASDLLRRRIGDTGLSPHVTLTGYTPDVHQYVANASVFVFTSLMEGLGTAVIEALAIGCPVVAYDIPPVREATDDGAFADLIEPGDHVSFAKTVMAVLARDDSDAESRVRFVRERYGMEMIASQVERRLEWVAAQ